MIDNRNQNKSFSQQNYVDSILSHANSTFSVLHGKFLKEIWGDNKTSNKLHSNQCFTDWQNGTYEVYIPTRDSQEYNLEYLRIAIQVLPMMSREQKAEETYKLAQPIKIPHGKIESELLILIAPRQYKWGIIHGFKHRNIRGYFTGIFVNASPDIVWKRVLDLLINFLGKRLDGLMDSLGFERWVWKWALKKHISLYYRILEHFSFVLRQSAFTLIQLWQHLLSKMKTLLGEIGEQNMALQAIHVLEGLNPVQLGRVFNKIRAGLHVEVELDKDALRVLEVCRRG